MPSYRATFEPRPSAPKPTSPSPGRRSPSPHRRPVLVGPRPRSGRHSLADRASAPATRAVSTIACRTPIAESPPYGRIHGWARTEPRPRAQAHQPVCERRRRCGTRASLRPPSRSNGARGSRRRHRWRSSRSGSVSQSTSSTSIHTRRARREHRAGAAAPTMTASFSCVATTLLRPERHGDHQQAEDGSRCARARSKEHFVVAQHDRHLRSQPSGSARRQERTPGRRANLDRMVTQADRAAERRRASMEKIQRQVKDGSLTIRKMTAEERKRNPPVASKGRRK